jgi:hypothetical protein
VRNSAPTEESHGVLEQLQGYVQTHDVMVSLPGDSQLTLSSRNINNGELNLSLKFDQEDSADVTEGKHVKEQLFKPWVANPSRVSTCPKGGLRVLKNVSNIFLSMHRLASQ